MCAQLLMRKSKPSPSSAYLREWKAGNLMRLQSRLISNPSPGKRFQTEWTSSLAVTPVSHLAQPGNDLEQKTQDTFGLSLQTEFGLCDPSSASLKTSKDTSLSDSEKSLENWNQWVIKCRGEYSRRVKLAHPTNVNESSFWPTCAARDYRDTGDLSKSDWRKDGQLRSDTLPRRVDLQYRPLRGKRGLVAPANFKTNGNRPAKSFPTLNPRWVETLMGLPVGWTMPSCASPVTVATTNSDSLATELSRPQQLKPL